MRGEEEKEVGEGGTTFATRGSCPRKIGQEDYIPLTRTDLRYRKEICLSRRLDQGVLFMYLKKLLETQKESFLDLCIILANRDANLAKEEKTVIDAFCEEMNIPFRYEARKGTDEAIHELASISSPEEKRIIVLELLGLVVADGKILEEERAFIKDVISAFGLEEKEVEELLPVLNELMNVYVKINRFVTRRKI